MKLFEIESLEKEMLTSVDIAPIMQSDPATIRWQARHEPEKLGFPVIVMKNRVKIPKTAFINFCKGARA